MTSGAEKSSNQNSKIITALYITGFLDLFGCSLFLPHLISRERKYGIASFLLGALMTCYGGIQLFSSPLVGSLSDRWGRKRVLLLCYFLTSVSYSGMALVDFLFVEFQFPYCVLLMLLVRVLAGFVKHSQTLSRAVLSDLTEPSDRAVVYGKFNAYSSFGFIVGPAISGHVMEWSRFGFALVCLLAAMLFLISAVFLSFIPLPSAPSKTNSPKHSSKSSPEPSYSVVMNGLYDIMALRFMLSLAALIYRATFSLTMEDQYGLSAKGIGYVTSAQSIFSAGSSFLSGPVSHFYASPVHQLFYVTLLYSLTIAGLTYAPTWEVMLIFLMLYSILNSLLRVSGAEVTTLKTPPEHLGTVTGVGQTVSSLARMAAPMVAGFATSFSVNGPGLSSMLFAVVSVLISYPMLKDSGRYLQLKRKGSGLETREGHLKTE